MITLMEYWQCNDVSLTLFSKNVHTNMGWYKIMKQTSLLHER